MDGIDGLRIIEDIPTSFQKHHRLSAEKSTTIKKPTSKMKWNEVNTLNFISFCFIGVGLFDKNARNNIIRMNE